MSYANAGCRTDWCNCGGGLRSALGSPSPVLTELFERVRGESFTAVLGSLQTSLIKSLRRVLREVLQQNVATFVPPLETAKIRDYIVLNWVPGSHPRPWEHKLTSGHKCSQLRDNLQWVTLYVTVTSGCCPACHTVVPRHCGGTSFLPLGDWCSDSTRDGGD